MASRRRSALSSAPPPGPSLYTAQDVARFCEVDLKTVHHWADRGKVAHFRTAGRHLRFRRNDVVRFLRGLGYPLPREVTVARPSVALAVAAPADVHAALAERFELARFATGVGAVARLTGDAPDALVLALDDPTLGGARALAALKSDPAVGWVSLAVVADEPKAARDAGADLVVGSAELDRLPSLLAAELALA